jgi:hypothetical protein
MATKKLTLDELKDLLNVAVDQRCRVYSKTFAISFRFELDNTTAANDTQHFQSVVRAFGFPAAEEYIIPATDKVPGWSVEGKLKAILTSTMDTNGRSLVMVHYSGHAKIDINGDLAFLASPEHPRSFKVQQALLNPVLNPVLEEAFNEENPEVDTIFILDSCYSGHVTRSATDVSRVVEVLAAVGVGEEALGNNPLRPKIQNRTFSAKLAGEIAQAKGKAASVEFSEIMASLRSNSPSKKPVHSILLGPNSIRLSFSPKQPSLPSRFSQNLQPFAPYRAVFALHLTDDLTEEEIEHVSNWIAALDPSIGLTVESVYRTNSVGFIVEGPYSLFSKLSGLPGVALVFEGTSGNLISKSSAPILSDSKSMPPKENLPFH